MQVADQPAPIDVAHDVFDRREGLLRVGLVVHGQEYAGDDLQHQDQHRQRAEVIPKIEIFWRVVFGNVLFQRFRERETFVDPSHEAAAIIGGHGLGSLRLAVVADD